MTVPLGAVYTYGKEAPLFAVGARYRPITITCNREEGCGRASQ